VRKIDKIILHCSASDNPKHDSIDVIRKWHLERGFSDVGYHFFINKNGTIQEGRKISAIGAHCQGHNATSIGICLHGINKFSLAQEQALFNLVDVTLDVYNLTEKNIFCHYQFNSNKTCPNFTIETFKKSFSIWQKQNTIDDNSNKDRNDGTEF